ncbi:hypothetical protein R3W88_014782 [Solanum pinnatisectum]|uniref:Uncharacterized protein n=1 Tax=Solanum pinnatisectum TaxID=50273 RepID=A0AAV9KSY3_9SOLN|nr:hypothetical protein R3W88_014782 [Solanum pinnatisectum]
MAVSFLAYLLIILVVLCFSLIYICCRNISILVCTKECGYLGLGICPHSEGSPKNPICINCCLGYKGCNYYNVFGTFICEGQSNAKNPNACPLNCDPNIAYSRCPHSEGKTLIYPTGCTTCCTRGTRIATISVKMTSLYVKERVMNPRHICNHRLVHNIWHQ